MENIMISIANFMGGGLILAIGLVLYFVRGSESLIAGYNTMDKPEQGKWNAIEMRMFLGKSFIVTSCVLLAGGLLAFLGVYAGWSILVSWVVFTVSLIFSLVYLNSNPKFKTSQK